MPISICEVRRDELQELIPLLLLAEPSESALRWGLKNLSDTAYRMDDENQLVGAATVRWHREPCEIMELAIAAGQQGRGLGRQFVLWLIEEGRRMGKGELFVGTSSTSVGNIIFYQRCGFRIDHIRHDYFWYYAEPPIEHGITVRDMLVFRYQLAEA